MPPLLELRKTIGLTLEEAYNFLHISAESLAAKEQVFWSIPAPYDLSTVRHRYFYFLSQFGNNREYNIIQDHLTLQAARRNIFHYNRATMGKHYGNYSNLEWYAFEMHEAILPREILEIIEYDVARNMESR
jgi:hypothetical protein